MGEASITCSQSLEHDGGGPHLNTLPLSSASMQQEALALKQTYVDLEVDATLDQAKLNGFRFFSKGGFGLVYKAELTLDRGPPLTVAVKVSCCSCKPQAWWCFPAPRRAAACMIGCI